MEDRMSAVRDPHLTMLPCGHQQAVWRPRAGQEYVEAYPDRPTAQEGWCTACGALIDRLYGPGGGPYYDPCEARQITWRLMD